MSSPFAASHPERSAREQNARRRVGPRHIAELTVAGVQSRWESISLDSRLAGIAVLGALAAAGVGATTAKNPLAVPHGVAVELRVTIIVALIAAGLYAQTSRIQAPMGALLTGAGFISSLWLLNGSSVRVAFSVGVVCSSVSPVLFAYLILAHPTGRLSSPGEARFLWLSGGVLALLWLLGVAMTQQPPLRTPLLQCTPHCPSNSLSLGSAREPLGVLRVAMQIAWLVLSVGTPLLVVRRLRSSPAPVRRAILPVAGVAVTIPLLLAVYLASIATGVGPAGTLGALYISLTLAVPAAILAGLGRERLFMGQTLADFVRELARLPQADPEPLMAAALRDPTLRIAYRRPALSTYVDWHGNAMPDFSGDTSLVWIEREGEPVAAVQYSAELSRDERFVEAAGAAALIRLETARLEADLKASTSNMAASRARLLETAHAERRRLERDLHDGVQQHLVGLRIKLEMAAEALKEDPAQGERLLAAMGQQMDDMLNEVRSLARGIYPSLLTERGVGEALRAAARNSPLPVEVLGRVGRYEEDVEVAVYFCCLEALQNVAKHAGTAARATVVLQEASGRLAFEVHDSGVGFNPRTAPVGSGLINMRDRIDAVGGDLEITARRGRGTRVRGSVPAA